MAICKLPLSQWPGGIATEELGHWHLRSLSQVRSGAVTMQVLKHALNRVYRMRDLEVKIYPLKGGM